MQGTALIVEDDKLEADRIGQLITDAHWRVVICHDILSACKLLNVEPFQLMLIDLTLRGESALAHLPTLRKLAPAMPIAAMITGDRFHDGDSALLAALQAGANFTVNDTLDDAQFRKLLGLAQVFKPVVARRVHIAVIDDCRAVRHLAIDALSDKGYRVSEAKMVEDALKNVRMGEVDIVLTEIFMPGMGGIAGIKHIRATWPHVKIIAMSGGLDDRMTIDKSLLAARVVGADVQLPKPFSAEQLIQATESLLQRVIA